jgi:hypothetical protein
MHKHSAIELFAGMGGLAVGAGNVKEGNMLLQLRRSYTHHFHFALRTPLGAVIMTAVAVQDVYSILAAFGVGLDIALGAGVMIATHVAANQVGSSSDKISDAFYVPSVLTFVTHTPPCSSWGSSLVAFSAALCSTAPACLSGICRPL